MTDCLPKEDPILCSPDPHMMARSEGRERTLYQTWRQIAAHYGLPGDRSDAVYNRLLNHYRGSRAQDNRAYHNTGHLSQVVITATRLGAYASTLPAVQLAAFFHDAIYRPGSADNERRSAALAQRELNALGAPPEAIAEVARLVLLTRTHDATASDRNGHVLLDADLTILGAPPAAYWRYARAIRREYAWLPDDAYRSGRAAVLKRFLEKEQIYRTPPFRKKWEERARSNLRQEMSRLQTGT